MCFFSEAKYNNIWLGTEFQQNVFLWAHHSHHPLADVFRAIPVAVELISSVYGDTQLLQKVLTSASGKQQDRVSITDRTLSTAFSVTFSFMIQVDIESMRQLRATQGRWQELPSPQQHKSTV